jgi:hypothetical protein
MDTKEIFTIIGWLVSCILSIFAGGWLIPRLTRKKKILLWAVITESELIAREVHQELSMPVSIQVGEATVKSLSLVTVRIGNAGNDVIEKITPAILFNPGASALYIKPRNDLGEFQKSIEGKIEADRVRITFEHINPKAAYEFELLLKDYEPGSLSVDVAAPGVDIIRRDASRWDLPAYAFRSFGLSFIGIKYSPQTTFMAEIDELG